MSGERSRKEKTEDAPLVVGVSSDSDDAGSCQGAALVVVRSGGPGNDTLTGTNAEDIMEGKGGNDTVLGFAESDVIYGGDGKRGFAPCTGKELAADDSRCGQACRSDRVHGRQAQVGGFEYVAARAANGYMIMISGAVCPLRQFVMG